MKNFGNFGKISKPSFYELEDVSTEEWAKDTKITHEKQQAF